MKEQDGDLGFVKGDILNIIEMKGDWWIGENDKGERGNVPANLLQKYNKYITIQKDDAEEEEEEEEEEAGDGDTYPRKKRHGKALWGSIKKAVTETTVSDVLHAMGAVPSGFRMSTLSKYFNESDTYRMINYLNPKLSVSNLMYKDLFFDPLTSKIRPRKVKIERIVTLVSCQQIPHPGSGIKLLSRHVRICLFDGQNILSNIHTVKVSDKNLEERTWLFSTRIFERMNISEHGETFIRTNSIVDNIGILFELGISYIREERPDVTHTFHFKRMKINDRKTSTEQKDEFSCGWVHLPLLDQDGTFVANRTFNLYVNGGTPYEKGVEVDPSISRRTSTNAFVSLISGNKQPRLVVRISLPKTEQKAQLDSLPDILVGNVALLPFYSYFRQIMADVLLRDRIDLDSTELVHSPLLANFPNVADQPDLMKVLRDAWIERLKTVERSQKPSFFSSYSRLRDEEFMKNLFKQVFMESVYPVVHTVLLPKYKTGDTDTEQKRHEQICHFDQIKRDRKSALAALLSSEMVFTPFNIKEVSFNVVGAHCMLKHTHTASVEG
ncbi:nephrocystin-1-like [Gigantopelta aegis]|uniref:nephrocystin-1-like n=1 Tax=Gigantopelta aegis TaxID=1735272 RepID=UPI001B88D53C|nr:nephrocystin-1-like [Gigantopelta aegis]